MKDAMPGIASSAQKYHEAHPGEYVKLGYLPSSVWSVFRYMGAYDFNYGEHFYDLSWNNGHSQAQILSDLDVPCVYLHAKESQAPNGTYLCAATREQAERAVGYIGDKCELIETSTSDHLIHTVHSDVYIAAVNSLLGK